MSELLRAGVLVLDKPAGITSHDAVDRVRRLYGTRQVGHTGTLDPMATGVLPILVGRAAKAAEFLGSDRKEYIASLRLGMTTDTEDVTGAPLSRYEGALPGWAEIRVAAASMVGKSEQLPPMYSAIKVGGKKLVNLARQHIEVEREPRPVEIFAIEMSTFPRTGDPELRVVCSKGTYIRSLCRDIGERLGCGGCMSALRRTESGRFSIQQAVTLEQLEQMSEEEKTALLLPVEALFADDPAVTLPPFFEKLARSGLEIYLRKIGRDDPVGTRLRLRGENGFFAIGEVRQYPDGNAVKPLKQFDL